MFLKKSRLCSDCKTGKTYYELDPRSQTCPYISCYMKNKCSFYVPLNEKKKPLDKLLDKICSPKK